MTGALLPRFERGFVERHPNRIKILAAIEDVPGLTFRGLVRALGLASGTVQYHVHRLERENRIWRLEVGCAHRYFIGPRPRHVTPELLLKSAMMDDLDQRIFTATTQKCMQIDLLNALQEDGTPRSTIQHRIQRLERLGILDCVRSGRCNYYTRRQDAC